MQTSQEEQTASMLCVVQQCQCAATFFVISKSTAENKINFARKGRSILSILKSIFFLESTSVFGSAE